MEPSPYEVPAGHACHPDVFFQAIGDGIFREYPCYWANPLARAGLSVAFAPRASAPRCGGLDGVLGPRVPIPFVEEQGLLLPDLLCE
jgi:hypothetical protein